MLANGSDWQTLHSVRIVNTIFALFLVIVLILWSLALDDTVGTAMDDGVYYVNAKALATGSGYRRIARPGEPPELRWAPGYPLVLALVWKISPQHPRNVVPMKFLSVLFLGTTHLLWLFLLEKYVSPVLAVLGVTVSISSVIVADTARVLMSDALFGLLATATIFFADRLYSAKFMGHRLRLALILAVGCSLAYLTRVSGIVVIGFVGVIVFREMSYRAAACFAVVVFICTLPWYIYMVTNRAFDSVRFAVGPATYPSALVSSVVGLLNNLLPTLVASPLFYSTRVKSVLAGLGVLKPVTWLAVAVTAVVMIYGAIRGRRLLPTHLNRYCLLMLGFHLLAPGWFEGRFLIPILPLVCTYLVCGLAAVLEERHHPVRITVVAACLIAGMSLTTSVRRAIDSAGGGTDRANVAVLEEWREISDWLKNHTASNESVVSSLPELIFVRTGVKAYATYDDHGRLLRRAARELKDAKFLVARPLNEFDSAERIAAANGVPDAPVAARFGRTKIFALREE